MPPEIALPSRGPAHRARDHGTRRAHAAVTSRRRGSARDVVITVCGIAGIATVAWLAASAALGLSLIVFITGSMGPSMPTGSAAVVEEVEASSLAIGDVVTVARPGSRAPVTHRIVAISAVPGSATARSLVLRGDANSIDDPTPYTVEKARRVVVAAPLLGWVILAAKTPLAMGGITFIVAAAIAWALWPSEARPRTEAR